jgi:hypothetical protein
MWHYLIDQLILQIPFLEAFIFTFLSLLLGWFFIQQNQNYMRKKCPPLFLNMLCLPSNIFQTYYWSVIRLLLSYIQENKHRNRRSIILDFFYLYESIDRSFPVQDIICLCRKLYRATLDNRNLVKALHRHGILVYARVFYIDGMLVPILRYVMFAQSVFGYYKRFHIKMVNERGLASMTKPIYFHHTN